MGTVDNQWYVMTFVESKKLAIALSMSVVGVKVDVCIQKGKEDTCFSVRC